MKPGFEVDNPPDLHDVSSVLSGGGARSSRWRERAPDDGAHAVHALVSLTGVPKLDREFVVDADAPDSMCDSASTTGAAPAVRRKITISHQRRRADLGRWCLSFTRTDHQSLWVDQPPPRSRDSARSSCRCGQPRGLRTGDRGTDVAALGDRGLRYTHERKEIDNAGGRYSLDAPNQAGSRFGLRLFRFHDARRLDAEDRPRDEAAA